MYMIYHAVGDIPTYIRYHAVGNIPTYIRYKLCVTHNKVGHTAFNNRNGRLMKRIRIRIRSCLVAETVTCATNESKQLIIPNSIVTWIHLNPISNPPQEMQGDQISVCS